MSRLRHAAVVTALAVTGGLLAPQGVAAAQERSAPDLIQVQGIVQVLAGEGGQPDRYSLLLRSGKRVPLAEGFTAKPLSRFSGTLAVPGTTSGRFLTGSARARVLGRAASSAGFVVRDRRVTSARPASGPTAHTTYVAKITNLGAFTRTDASIVQQLDAAQSFWVRESAGMIPSWTTLPGIVPVNSTAASVAGGCGLGMGGSQFDAIAEDVAAQAYPGVDFSGESPNHLVVMLPNACYFQEAVGRATVGISLASGGPAIAVEAQANDMRDTMEHEFGHTVGLQHANNARAEYGDLYEVMGSGPSGYTNPVLGTIYRWEEGLIAAGETVDGNAGGTWAVASRAAATGMRSVVFIDPDTGLRTFVDYRDGTGADATSAYAAELGTFPSYGQRYLRGLVIEREDRERGAFVHDVPGVDGVLQAGEQWSNQSGSMVVRATAANTVQVTRTQMPALPAGTASISGDIAPFKELSAVGTVAGATAYRYQWLLNGQPIAQADDRTFEPTLGMVGGTLSVQVTGYGVGRNPSPTATSTATTVPPAGWYRQTGTPDATVSGKARVGEVLTANGLDWVNWNGVRPAGLAVSYKWFRNGKLIKGARKSTYRLGFRDLKKRIEFKEYPSAPGFVANDFTRSDSTRKVRIGKLRSPRPTIGGKIKVGKRVVARTSGWTKGTKFRYSWFVNGRAVRGAHAKKLRVTRSMKRKKIQVKVVGTKKGFKSASAKSAKKKVR